MGLAVDDGSFQQQRQLASNSLRIGVASLVAQSTHQRLEISTEPNTGGFHASVLFSKLYLRVYRKTAREVAAFECLSAKVEYRQQLSVSIARQPLKLAW